MTYRFRFSDIADAADYQAVVEPLVAYNEQRASRPSEFKPLAILIDNAAAGADADGVATIGGLTGRTAYGWLFIELLFVPESLRGQGVGAELMRRAEQEALVRGCHSAWLDTFAFQARGFYQRLGYRCFGELPDYPDAPRYFMCKKLTPGN